MLSNKKTIEENKAEIKRQEKIQADATKNTKESGGMVQINAAQAIIDRLKADNVALGETIRLQEKASKQAEYDIQNDKQKIAIKKAENAELEQKLKMLGKEPKTGKDLNSELRENINKQILQNNKEISIAQGKIDEANNIPLQSRVTLLAEIKKVEKEINDLREKSKTGINATEKQKLEDAGKELASLKSELESMTGVKETKAKTEKNPYDKVKVALENARKVEDAEYESQVKILETQKDSAEKSLKLLELEGKRKLAVLERQRVDTISAMEKDAKEDKKENKSHDAGAWKKKIEEYNKFLESQKTQQEEVNKKATEEFIKSQLEQYLTYTEKVAKLEEEAKMKIADFEAIATKEGDVNKYAEKIKLVRQELEKALFELDQTSNKTVVGKLFADNTHTTIEAMKEIVVEAEKMYSALAGKEGTSPETLKAIREQIDKLKISIKETDNGFKEMGEGIFDILSGDYPTGGITESLSKIENGLNTVMKAGRFLSDSLMSLGESFGNKDMQNVAQTMDDVMSVASATMDGAKLGAQIGGSIGAAAGAAIGLATSLAKVFSAKHDRKQEREIQKLQVQVDTLKKTYDTLGKAIDKAYSSDASQLIQQQDENLRRQKTLLEQQIKAEEGKKKADKNKINGWKDAIYQIDQQLLLTEDKQIEAINGKSVQSAISDFASAYVNAWSAGEDKAKAMKDVVKNMVKSAITELVKSRLKGEVEAFSKYLASAMEDGILSVAEQNVLDSLEMAINDKMKGLSSTLDAYVLDDKVNEEGVNREATTKGFANMSQDSADELNGRFATLQAHTYSITESIKTLQLNSMIQLKHLAGIETNTASLVRLENIENNIVRMKLSIDDINDKGIIIRR
jgi:DNA repair exonuclease SbcCD ATPase subunit